jgi:hypothetical protein
MVVPCCLLVLQGMLLDTGLQLDAYILHIQLISNLNDQKEETIWKMQVYTGG